LCIFFVLLQLRSSSLVRLESSKAANLCCSGRLIDTCLLITFPDGLCLRVVGGTAVDSIGIGGVVLRFAHSGFIPLILVECLPVHGYIMRYSDSARVIGVIA